MLVNFMLDSTEDEFAHAVHIWCICGCFVKRGVIDPFGSACFEEKKLNNSEPFVNGAKRTKPNTPIKTTKTCLWEIVKYLVGSRKILRKQNNSRVENNNNVATKCPLQAFQWIISRNLYFCNIPLASQCTIQVKKQVQK